MGNGPEVQLLTRRRLADAWNEHRAGRLAAAEAAYRQVLTGRPDDAEANNLLGLLCLQTGRPSTAKTLITRALQADPNNAQSEHNLGLACAQLAEFAEAEAHFRRVVELRPGDADVLSPLGEVLLARNQPGAAREVLERAVTTQAASADTWNNLGVACERDGRYEQAVAAFQRAVTLQPGHARARMNLGRMDEQAGRLDAAATRYREAIAIDGTCVDAHFHLAQLRSQPLTPSEIQAMQDLALRVTDRRQRARLNSGLGVALDAVGDYVSAFRCMQRAHEELGKLRPFNLEAERARTARIVALFDPALVDRLHGCGLDDPRPLLVVGLPRSGTTLAEQILASHEAVRGLGETLALAGAVRTVSASPNLPFPSGLGTLEPEALRTAATHYLRNTAAQAGTALRITDTTPMNWVMLGMAALMLPSARFVYCRRHPLDHCLSIYRQWLSGPHAYANDLADLGAYWLLHRRLMEHWQTVFPGRIHELRYEALVAEPEKTIRELLDFCGLPFQPQCLSFHRTERTVRSPSASLVRQPLQPGSVGIWQRYETQLAPLIAALGDEALDARRNG